MERRAEKKAKCCRTSFVLRKVFPTKCGTLHNGIYPPTPADARGSAPGNKIFDSCFGLLPQPAQQQPPARTSFRPSGPLCFPVRQRAFSASGGRAAAATGAGGGFYVSLCLIVQTAVQKMVENYCFSRVSEGTLGNFWARFWRRSVLQGHCVSLSGSVRFQLREEEQQQQQEQQEGSMSLYVSLYKQRYKKWWKTIVFLGFQKGR